MPTKGWDNKGFLNDGVGSSRAHRNQGDGHGKGVELMI